MVGSGINPVQGRNNSVTVFGHDALCKGGCVAAGIHNCATTVIGALAHKDMIGTVCGQETVIIGAQAGRQCCRTCCAQQNVYIGYQAGCGAVITQCLNYNYLTTAIGACANAKVKSSNWNTFLGFRAGECTCTSWGQTYIGSCAGRYNISCYDTRIGHMAGERANFAKCSVMIGTCAGYCACFACAGTMIGFKAGCRSIYGFGSVVIGHCAAYLACMTICSVIMGACVGGTKLCCFLRGIAIGYMAAVNVCCSHHSVYIGCCTSTSSSTLFNNCMETVIGHGTVGCGCKTTVIGNSSTTKVRLEGPLTKGGGSFRIVHPNPSKKSKWLNHSFVESPNEGDNIYRWTVKTCNCFHSIALPEYYKHLNKNSMTWLKPVGHFGKAYAEIDDSQENLNICSSQDGEYNVLLIGTRKDKDATSHWKGVERDK